MNKEKTIFLKIFFFEAKGEEKPTFAVVVGAKLMMNSNTLSEDLDPSFHLPYP